MPDEPELYRTIDGHLYVLVTKAVEELLGASDDALEIALRLVRALRPADKDLHAAIEELQRHRKTRKPRQ